MPYTLRQNPASPNNYTNGRAGVKINKIVIHHAATTDFDGIGRTFKDPGRGASAHYGVGRSQNVDQYVAEANTAWHAGNWPANISSVGIENVNSNGAPTWDIDEATFNTLVELTRDIASRNGLLPLVVGQNLFGHKDFKATACPGDLYARLQELANRVNGSTGGGGSTPQPPRKSNDQVANEVIAGAWGNNPSRADKLRAAGYDPATIQSIVNQKLGGGGSAPAAPSRPSDSQIADQVIAGAWGSGDDRKKRLAAAGYNYAAVQALVNQKLGAGPSAPARKSDDQVANEVIAGGWGNNPDRANKLKAAGYNPATIQALVNRKLGF
jgi:N-acetylmuramoyl-L-alanine amidase